MSEPKPSQFQVWKLAARPHTLTASFVPVIVGYALTLQLIHRNPDNIILQLALSDEESACTNHNEQGVCIVNSSSPSSALSHHHATLLPIAIQFAIFAGLIQISTNLHNDYADFVKGADTDKRVGQARATQKGWLTPYETCRGCLLTLLGSLFVGMYYLIPYNPQCSTATEENDGALQKMTTDYYDYYDPIMVFIVLSSLFNAVAYTGGPFPLGYIGLGNISIGYSGLGDLFVFLYFGIVATLGTPYLYLTKMSCISPTMQMPQLQQLLYTSILHSIPIGFLATAIIVVNNLRDRHTDIHAGKRTVAVRFGGTFAKMEYLVLVLGSYGFCIYFWFLENRRQKDDANAAWAQLLPLLSIPMSIPQLKAVAFGGKDGQDLNDHVGGTAKLQMVFCLLMTVGLVLSS